MSIIGVVIRQVENARPVVLGVIEWPSWAEKDEDVGPSYYKEEAEKLINKSHGNYLGLPNPKFYLDVIKNDDIIYTTEIKLPN